MKNNCPSSSLFARHLLCGLFLYSFLLLCAFSSFIIPSAHAQGRSSPSVMLDAEADAYLHQVTEPLLRAAGIPPQSVTFALINSPDLNAFVTPERAIFINTGTVLQAKTADELTGVLAHEIGHIKGRHLLKMEGETNRAMIPAVLGAVVGIGAAAAGADPQIAMAATLGGQATAMSNMLRFSRSQEQQADEIAVGLLSKTGHNSADFLHFMETLQQDNLLYTHDVPPYLLTHPLPRERVADLRARVAKLPAASSASAPSSADTSFTLLQARIFALTHSQASVLRKMGGSHTLPSLYASAIAATLAADTENARTLTQKILAQRPTYPFFYEVQAQIEQDAGHLPAALSAYERLLHLAPQASLARYQYAELLNAAEKPKEAIPHLQRLRREMNDWPPVLHTLGIAYGKAGMLADSHLTLAEEGLLLGQKENTLQHYNEAKRLVSAMKKPSATLRERLADLKTAMDAAEKDGK